MPARTAWGHYPAAHAPPSTATGYTKARAESPRKRPGAGVRAVCLPCAGGCPDANGNRAPPRGTDAKATRSRTVLIFPRTAARKGGGRDKGAKQAGRAQ